MVVADHLATRATHFVSAKIKLLDFFQLEIDFRAQQAASGPPQFVPKKTGECDVHECRFVIVPWRIGQHGYLDLAATYFRIELGHQMVGGHCAANASSYNQNVMRHLYLLF